MKINKRRAFLLTAGSVLFLAFLYSALFIHMVKVPTGSMKNTILPGDRLAVHMLMGEIQRGDIVMFNYPEDPAVRFVMRVIGLPGETIEVRGERVYINGVELAEKRAEVKSQLPDDPSPLEIVSSNGEGNYSVSYYADEHTAEASVYESGRYAVKEPFQIPANSYFVMGDNRDNALDSRFWGVVQRKMIIGKPFLIYWSDDLSTHTTRWGRMPSRLK
ncbi:MAG: signal peptidase [Blastocatellia bacterium]